ncbi:arylsulfotransferase family protein [Marimonas arenosa]|uniref:Arylsulfotransferase family protein n=1 Tax=Marimonas arenosa TaxID=1795305 RepID=A0AAE3WFJ1_9RHOB|nr:arylsulfotransferase family protein [Marimonas arenosa]MDQ2091598.1 arylsulfotransferase family protein [Marimonas arenosa]
MDDERKERLGLWLGAAMAGFLGLMLFSWAALQALIEPGKVGLPGRVALNVAFLPSKVKDAWDEAMSFASGAEATRFFSVPRPALDETGFRPVLQADGNALSGLQVRGDVAAADRGWRLIGGAMQVGGRAGNMAVLLDPDLVARRIWRLDEDAVEAADKSRDSRRMLHGLQILPEAGSIVFGFDHGSALQRRDMCNRTEWITAGKFHHSVTLSPDGYALWALRDGGFASDFAPDDLTAPPNTGLVRLDAATGEIVEEISLEALVAANAGLGLFELARKDANEVETNEVAVIGRWISDPMHFNDIEALRPEMAAAFPDFTAGDLLVSARDINTVMVIDPETHKVKWHQTGGFMRQHDPDWRPDGTISVFDNGMSTGVSRIQTVDAKTNHISVAYDGAEMDFYTRIRGKHMRTTRGDLAIVSPQQGRAFELDAGRRPVLEFRNHKPGSEEKNFVLTEYLWLPETALTAGDLTCSDS